MNKPFAAHRQKSPETLLRGEAFLWTAAGREAAFFVAACENVVKFALLLLKVLQTVINLQQIFPDRMLTIA